MAAIATNQTVYASTGNAGMNMRKITNPKQMVMMIQRFEIGLMPIFFTPCFT